MDMEIESGGTRKTHGSATTSMSISTYPLALVALGAVEGGFGHALWQQMYLYVVPPITYSHEIHHPP